LLWNNDLALVVSGLRHSSQFALILAIQAVATVRLPTHEDSIVEGPQTRPFTDPQSPD
jgi:hypothetical protein